MKKVLARIGTLLLVIAMTLAIIPGSAFAEDADPTVPAPAKNSITLTKYTEGTGTATQTDGLEVTPDTGSPLKGVSFQLYKTNLTPSTFKGVSADATTSEGVLPAPTTVNTASLPTGWSAVESAKTTNDKGVVTWTNLDDAVYLVVETAHPMTVSKSSVPFYVILPYTYTQGDIAGTTTRDVFVYPKNEMAPATLYTVKVSGGNTSDRRKNATYEVAAAGEEIDFYSSFELGVTTEEITELTIVDTSDDALSVPTKAADVEITLGTTVCIPVTDYTLTKDAAVNKFTIKFTDAGLASLRSVFGTNGTTMGLAYTSTFSGTIPKEYRNTIKATTNDSNPDSGAISSEDFAKITTGSARITKYKADGETPLEGVTFRLTDSEGNTADVTTDEDGIAYWEGLGNGTYTIQEVATAGGYTLNPKAKTFKIADIVDDVDEDNTDLNWVGEMNNYEQPRLPLTGGTGITIIALIGIALIGGAVLLIKRKNVAK